MGRWNRSVWARAVVAAAAVAGSPALGRADTYTGTVLYRLSVPGGINAVGITGYQPTVGSQTVGYGTATIGGASVPYALLWSLPGGSPVYLNPSGFTQSFADAASGTRQVGYGSGRTTGNANHALLWAGTAASAVDLNPAGMSASMANGIAGDQQVGSGSGTGTGGADHALLWAGTAASAVDLNPAGFDTSYAFGTNGTRQVGAGQGASTAYTLHALLWTAGTAASAVDLHPTALTGFTTTFAYGVSGGQQVGSGTGNAIASHALLWAGTAASAVDLNPSAAITQSAAYGTNGSVQVGTGSGPATTNRNHAFLWSGTAASAVDLHGVLPTTATWTDSSGYAVDAAGDVFGSAASGGSTYAVEWTPAGAEPVVVAADNSYLGVPARTAGIKVRRYGGISVDARGEAFFPPTTSTGNRAVVVAGGFGLILAGGPGAWTGLLDLGNNDLDVPDGSLATLTSQARQGFAGGTWNGAGGITSSSAAADANRLTAVGVIQNATAAGAALYTTFDGQPVTATDVLARYTLYGDADLNGTVNAADYARLDAGFLSGATGWGNGDFNYDGAVDGSDYTLADNAFNRQAGGIAAPAAAVASPPAAVPEPAAGLAAAAALAGLGRRRRSTAPPRAR